MKGGTTFHFVDAEPTEALALARELADGGDVRIGGGVATVRQFLAADLIDHLYLVVVPIVLGRGERLWDGLEGIEDATGVDVAGQVIEFLEKRALKAPPKRPRQIKG